jgi:hypothetical protein
LGTARCARQISQILAWMRALGITPRVRTLAYALVFWAEVSISAPLLELPRGWGRVCASGAVDGRVGRYRERP